jgi:hypothetical protein
MANLFQLKFLHDRPHCAEQHDAAQRPSDPAGENTIFSLASYQGQVHERAHRRGEDCADRRDICREKHSAGKTVLICRPS